MPVPTYSNELFKAQKNQELRLNNDRVLNIETEVFEDNGQEYEVTEPAYLSMRLSLVFSLWKHIQAALNSSWSNI